MRMFQSLTDCTDATDPIVARKATPQTQVAEATLLAQHNRNERCNGGAKVMEGNARLVAVLLSLIHI